VAAAVILCVGLAADSTFVHGLGALSRAGVAFQVVDLPMLAATGDLVAPLDDLRSTRIHYRGRPLVLGDFQAILCRPVDVSSAAPDQRLSRRAEGQYRALIRVLESVDMPVLNPPLREASNFAKVVHGIHLAGQTGWRIPRTCLTNDPVRAREFLRDCPNGAIFKGASAAKTWATAVAAEHERGLADLSDLPVLFQERVIGPDVRVHVVGERAFAEIIHSGEVDYRRARGGKRFAPITPPPEVLHGCARLVAACGLPFLGVDFKIEASNDEWIFLEANAMPCYEGYDVRAGGAISRALVDWLTARPGAA
jgi:glutathione synthase/RimK-type ligase-like ATP-grasp enzyme